MILETELYAPLQRDESMDGMITVDGVSRPGAILKLWGMLRSRVGVLAAERKPGMKYDTRSADKLVDKIRPVANELGILIYPTSVVGSEGFPVEDGTLAVVQLTIIAQAIEDGSRLQFGAFGLGADKQDKAGGKAGTYAFKQALLQALLAAGSDDTDDTDTPIKGGVRKKQVAILKVLPTIDEVSSMFVKAQGRAEYIAAREVLRRMNPDDIVQLRDIAKTAKERCGVE